MCETKNEIEEEMGRKLSKQNKTKKVGTRQFEEEGEINKK